MPQWTATCHCRQLRLTITAAPRHVHACTCTRCQNASGSMGSWNGWFPKADVVVEGQATRYGYDRSGASTESWSCFCPVCGSGGYGVTGEFLTDCYVIPMGSLASPDGAPPPKPTMVHYWDDRPDWLDGIATLKGGHLGW